MIEDALRRIESAMLADETPLTDDLRNVARFVLRAVPALNYCEDTRYVDLAYCIGSDCIKKNGTRLATWRAKHGILVCCDECHKERLDDEERAEMVEILGAPVVRRLGLHSLVNGRMSK